MAKWDSKARLSDEDSPQISRKMIALRLTQPRVPVSEEPGSQLIRKVALVTLGSVAAIALFLICVVLLVSFHPVVDAGGRLEPLQFAQVRSSLDGQIDAILVSEGDTVVSGQPLLQLRNSEARRVLNELEISLSKNGLEATRLMVASAMDREQLDVARRQAAASVLRADAVLRQRLIDYGLVDSVEVSSPPVERGRHVGVDIVRADVETAEAELSRSTSELARMKVAPLDSQMINLERRRLTAQVSAARELINDATIVAPIDGVVLGQLGNSLVGSTIRNGQAILAIDGLRGWRAIVQVGEAEVSNLKVGDSAHVELHSSKGYSAAPIKAVVSWISQTPTGTELAEQFEGLKLAAGPRTPIAYVVHLDLVWKPGSDDVAGRKLKYGMSIRAKILGQRVRLWSVVRRWVDVPAVF